jgi:hypothetical protein
MPSFRPAQALLHLSVTVGAPADSATCPISSAFLTLPVTNRHAITPR